MKDYINAIKHIIYKELMPDVTDEMRVKMVQAVFREIAKEAVGQDDAGFDMPKQKQIYRNNLRSEILLNIEKVIGGK